MLDFLKFYNYNIFERIRNFILYWLYEGSDSNISSFENEILSNIDKKMEKKLIKLSNGQQIWTIYSSLSQNQKFVKIPLVMLHGFASGSALWSLNLKSFAEHRAVYAIDLPGFARSNRIIFPKFESVNNISNLHENKICNNKIELSTSKKVDFNDNVSEEVEYYENMFTETLELWRKAIGLDSFILLGHCFGAYIGACYSIKYPQNIKHFIPVNPWGFAIRKPPKEDNKIIGIFSTFLPQPFWIKSASNILSKWNPLTLLRLAGNKYGPLLVLRFKPDFISYYNHYVSKSVVAKYIYHCNSRKPIGESLYWSLSMDFGWAKSPILLRIGSIPSELAMTFIFGSRSYIDSEIGQSVRTVRNHSYVDIQILNGCGHYLFAEKPDLFNELVNKICLIVDHHLDVLKIRHRVQSESQISSPRNHKSLTGCLPIPIGKTQHTHRTSVALTDQYNFDEEDEMILDEGLIDQSVIFYDNSS